METPNDGSDLYYRAAAVNAALSMSDYMSYEQASPISSTLATECGSMWKSVIIGGADIETALTDVIAKVSE